MYNTTIRSGPTEIISSGTLINYAGNTLDITIEFPNWKLLLIFEFENKVGEKQDVRGSSSSPNDLKITFTNYDNPLGTGNVEPLKIATYENKIIYLSYRIYALNGSTDKIVHYTIYKDAAEVNKS